MHGDEVANCELLLRLIHYLASRYGSDQRVTQLLQNVHVMILPIMNPDGLTSGQRQNANGYDLNRNFPLEGAPYSKALLSIM
jgi:carboxypeptidase D